MEFLKHLQQRKLGEMLKVQSDLEAIDSDISLVRAHLQHLQAMRAAKRRRAGGHIGAAAGAGTTPPGIGPGAKPALPTSSSYQTHTHTQHPSHSLQAGPSNSGPSNSQSSGGAGVGGAGAGAGSGPATSLHTQGDGPGHHHHHHVQDTATAAMSAHDEQQLLAAEEKWHRVAPVFAQLQSLYLQRRADALASQQPGTDQGRGHVDQGEAEVTPQRPQLAGGPSSAAAAGDARARDDGLRGVDGRAPGTPAGAMHTPPADAAAQPGSSGGSGQVGSGSAPAQAKTQQPQPLPPSQPLPQHMINFAQVGCNGMLGFWKPLARSNARPLTSIGLEQRLHVVCMLRSRLHACLLAHYTADASLCTALPKCYSHHT